MAFLPDDHRLLAGTDLVISPIGLGTVKFGRNTRVHYPEPFEIPNDRTLEKLLVTASDLGINLIDTAPAYGDSESRIGRLLAGQRERWVLSTKVGEHRDGTFDFSMKAVDRSIHNSLQRLRTDRIDIVLVHCSDDDLRALDESDVIPALRNLQLRGDIRYIGASTKTVEGGLRALDLTDLVMVAYHPGDTSQRPVLRRAADLNKGVLVKKALASGHAEDTAGNLRYSLNTDGVTSVIVGTIDAAHLENNVRAVLERE